MRLKDLKIIVTGATGGMGSHFVKRLAQGGAKVAAGNLDEANLARLVEETGDGPGKVFARRLDVADEVDGFVTWAREQMDGLNGLINNAAILRDALLVKKDRQTGEVTKLSREAWQKVIDVNLTGATWMVRDVVASMMEHNEKAGVIVNMSSLARFGNRGQSNYVAAKAALAANTVTWAREFSRFGIRVGAIAPGMIETPMTKGMNQAARDTLVSQIPAGRIGQPEDIWQAVQFIIECDYFTGRCIDVDGGLTM